MKRILKKLRGKAGESLVEVLCAVLIFALASVAMHAMVMAANNINAEAKKADASFQEQMLIVERAEGTVETGTASSGTIAMTFRDSDGDLHTFQIAVDVYQTEGLYSYFEAGEGGGQ